MLKPFNRAFCLFVLFLLSWKPEHTELLRSGILLEALMTFALVGPVAWSTLRRLTVILCSRFKHYLSLKRFFYSHPIQISQPLSYHGILFLIESAMLQIHCFWVCILIAPSSAPECHLWEESGDMSALFLSYSQHQEECLGWIKFPEG